METLHLDSKVGRPAADAIGIFDARWAKARVDLSAGLEARNVLSTKEHLDVARGIAIHLVDAARGLTIGAGPRRILPKAAGVVRNTDRTKRWVSRTE